MSYVQVAPQTRVTVDSISAASRSLQSIYSGSFSTAAKLDTVERLTRELEAGAKALRRLARGVGR